MYTPSPCSLGLSATSQQYFSLRTNQPPATSQQYFSLRTNQHQPSATSQTRGGGRAAAMAAGPSSLGGVGEQATAVQVFSRRRVRAASASRHPRRRVRVDPTETCERVVRDGMGGERGRNWRCWRAGPARAWPAKGACAREWPASGGRRGQAGSHGHGNYSFPPNAKTSISWCLFPSVGVVSPGRNSFRIFPLFLY
jgi:hypothetical protein